MTAKCSVNNTWGPLDMSQCTFRSDVQVAGVAVVEVLSLEEDAVLDMDVREESLLCMWLYDNIQYDVYVHV